MIANNDGGDDDDCNSKKDCHIKHLCVYNRQFLRKKLFPYHNITRLYKQHTWVFIRSYTQPDHRSKRRIHIGWWRPCFVVIIKTANEGLLDYMYFCCFHPSLFSPAGFLVVFIVIVIQLYSLAAALFFYTFLFCESLDHYIAGWILKNEQKTSHEREMAKQEHTGNYKNSVCCFICLSVSGCVCTSMSEFANGCLVKCL